MRILRLKAILHLKEELAGEERKRRADMHPMVSQVTHGKPLVLWEKLLQMSRFPDASVVGEHMSKGVQLVGHEPDSLIYDKKYKPLITTPQQLTAQFHLEAQGDDVKAGHG